MFGSFEQEWTGLEAPFRRCLELAAEALWAGGLAVGAVVTAEDGSVVAEGRNHAYDAATRADPLERTPIAHAEMNALARVDTDFDLSSATLWSSHAPCPMCSAAASFVGVGRVRALAPDPSDGTAATVDGSDLWVVVADVLFLAGVIARRGPDSPMIVRSRRVEPELTDLAVELQAQGRLAPGQADLARVLAMVWPEVTAAAEGRHRRRS